MIDRIVIHAPAIRRASLLTIVVGVPVAFLRFTNDPFNVPKVALLAIGVSVAGATWLFELTQRQDSFRKSPLLIPIGAIALAFVAATLFSPYREWSVLGHYPRFQGLFTYLLFATFGLLLAHTFQDRATDLAMAFVWAGALVGAYTVVQVIGADPFEWSLSGTPTSTISTTGNPNFTGGFLGIALAVAVAVALSDESRRKTTVRLLIPLVAGWLLARSQGGWAAGFAGVAIVVGSYFSTRWSWSRAAGLLAATLGGVAVVGAVLISTIAPTSRVADASQVVRGRWWSAATEMAMASPAVGRGPNSFAIEGVSYRTTEDAVEFGYDFPDDPHSVPLSFAANLGLLGMAAYLILLVWTLRRGIRTPAQAMIQIGFFGGAIAYFVQSLVSIDEPILRLGLWVCLAGMTTQVVTQRASKKKVDKVVKNKGSRALIPGSIALVLAGSTVLGALLWSGVFVWADVQMQQAEAELANRDVPGALESFESALSLRRDPFYAGIKAFAVSDLVLESDSVSDQSDSAVDRLDELRPLYEEALAAFSFVEDVPYLFSVVSYADLLDEWAQLNDEPTPQEALDLYAEALDRDPKNPLIRAEYADALIHAGDFATAFAVTSEYQGLVGDRYPSFWGTLALSAAHIGEDVVAEAAITRAQSLSATEEHAAEAEELLTTSGSGP